MAENCAHALYLPRQQDQTILVRGQAGNVAASDLLPHTYVIRRLHRYALGWSPYVLEMEKQTSAISPQGYEKF